MPPNKHTQPTLPSGGYMPYHYASGSFLWYSPAKETDHSLYSDKSRSSYDFLSDTVPKKRDEGPQTIEQMIYKGYLSIPGYDPETAILHDKKHTSWLGLDDVLHQIQQRFEIYSRHMYEIEQGKCYAINDLHAWEDEMGRPASYEQQAFLGKRLQMLYADQRLERTSTWSDISRLRQSLPESVQLYLGAFRKIKILEDQGDDPS